MYNLLIHAKDKAWENSYCKYAWERVLEYTEPYIKEKNRDSGNYNFDEMKKHPALFIYECFIRDEGV